MSGCLLSKRIGMYFCNPRSQYLYSDNQTDSGKLSLNTIYRIILKSGSSNANFTSKLLGCFVFENKQFDMGIPDTFLFLID